MKYFTRSIRFSLSILACVVVVSCTDANVIAKIEYDLEGCFGAEKSTLKIYKQDGRVKASLEKQDKKTAKIIIVSALQMDTFDLFINELRNLKEEHGCTTISHYSVFYNNERFNKTDGRCNWHGFTKLEECLFGPE